MCTRFIAGKRLLLIGTIRSCEMFARRKDLKGFEYVIVNTMTSSYGFNSHPYLLVHDAPTLIEFVHITENLYKHDCYEIIEEDIPIIN